jgi:hypothetical protein
MQTQTYLRERALARLKKKSEFKAHVLVYAMVNALLVTVWAMTGAHSFGRSSRSRGGGSASS